jgi:hypothetical protein
MECPAEALWFGVGVHCSTVPQSARSTTGIKTCSVVCSGALETGSKIDARAFTLDANHEMQSNCDTSLLHSAIRCFL